jgi:hypothetical protein
LLVLLGRRYLDVDVSINKVAPLREKLRFLHDICISRFRRLRWPSKQC